mmetsp:Transcript_27418/g.66688  ORF Transcript_27418/g.66688 Transcript_27418/m.66688 type:complete len:290 (+) Transcript_27418:348-1217(+)
MAEGNEQRKFLECFLSFYSQQDVLGIYLRLSQRFMKNLRQIGDGNDVEWGFNITLSPKLAGPSEEFVEFTRGLRICRGNVSIRERHCEQVLNLSSPPPCPPLGLCIHPMLQREAVPNLVVVLEPARREVIVPQRDSDEFRRIPVLKWILQDRGQLRRILQQQAQEALEPRREGLSFRNVGRPGLHQLVQAPFVPPVRMRLVPAVAPDVEEVIRVPRHAIVGALNHWLPSVRHDVREGRVRLAEPGREQGYVHLHRPRGYRAGGPVDQPRPGLGVRRREDRQQDCGQGGE